jgi:hypothetical protein
MLIGTDGRSGSRIVFRNSSVGQRPTGPGTSTPGREGSITCGYIPPADGANVRDSNSRMRTRTQLRSPLRMHRTRDSITTPLISPLPLRGSEVWNQQEHEGQGTVTGQPPEAHIEPVSEGSHAGKRAGSTVGVKSAGDYWFPHHRSNLY